MIYNITQSFRCHCYNA